MDPPFLPTDPSLPPTDLPFLRLDVGEEVSGQQAGEDRKEDVERIPGKRRGRRRSHGELDGPGLGTRDADRWTEWQRSDNQLLVVQYQ